MIILSSDPEITLPDPPEGYEYYPEYLRSVKMNNDPNSMMKICYDGPIYMPKGGICFKIIE